MNETNNLNQDVTTSTPVQPAAPVTEPTPVQPAAPVAEPTPVQPAAPVTEPTPVQPAAPVTEPAPVQPAVPVTEPAPVQPAAPVTEPAPVQPAAPVTEPAPVQPQNFQQAPMGPQEPKKKNNAVFIIVVVILVLAIVGLVVVFVLGKGNFNFKKNDVNTEEKNNDNNQNEENKDKVTAYELSGYKFTFPVGYQVLYHDEADALEFLNANKNADTLMGIDSYMYYDEYANYFDQLTTEAQQTYGLVNLKAKEEVIGNKTWYIITGNNDEYNYAIGFTDIYGNTSNEATVMAVTILKSPEYTPAVREINSILDNATVVSSFSKGDEGDHSRMKLPTVNSMLEK